MNKLTDEQATQAEKIIADYNKKYKESIKNIAKHRVPCNVEDTIIAGRELNVEGNEIIFPPYGQGFKTNLQDYITIKANNNNEKSIKDKNIGKE